MVTVAEPAAEAGRMARLLLAEAAEVEQRRMALSRYALVWWQGEAAEAYQRRVHERVSALAALVARLQAAARLWQALEDAAREVSVAADAGGPEWR